MNSMGNSRPSQNPIKVILSIGIAIACVSTFGFYWTQPDSSKLSSLHLSTTRTKTVTFQRQHAFSDLSHDSDGNWSALLPPNGGFVVEKIDDEYEMAGITMFHQIHCLQMIRSAIQDMKSGRLASGRRSPGHGKHDGQVDVEPWLHCLDYLMQGVLCSADDTIELAHEGKHGRVVDGYEVQHKCRDPDSLWVKVMGAKSTPGWKYVLDNAKDE